MAAFPIASTADFDQLALAAPGVVVVDFFTPDCIPCRKLEPMIAAVAQEFGERLSVVKVDASASPEVAVRYGVRGAPTLLLVKGGQVLDRKSGFVPASQLRAWIRPHLVDTQ